MRRCTKIAALAYAGILLCPGPQADPGRHALELAPEQKHVLTLARPSTADPGRPGSRLLDLDRAGYDALWSKGVAVVRDFPLPGRRPVHLELSAFSILTADARVVVVDHGVEREVPRPATRHFRGAVSGDAGSLVSLSLSQGSIAGFIRAWGEEFSFGGSSRDPGGAERSRLEVRNETARAATRAPTSICEGPPWPPRVDLRKPRSAVGASTSGASGTGTLIAYIAVDSTVEWFQIFGSAASAQGQILNIMAQVSTIYENELQIEIQVPFLRLFASEPDPYDGGSLNAQQLLFEMRQEWNANQTGVSRTAAHLIGAHPTARAGVAGQDVLCESVDQPGDSHDYAVSLVRGEGAATERDLVAHELGHNFSSRHTHCYDPEIDRCYNETLCYQGTPVQTVGTLMSYCNTIVPEFHTRVKNEAIRPAALAAVPACIDIGGEPIDVTGLRLSKSYCKHGSMATGDGGVNGAVGESGINRLTWVKRLTPDCYPFALRSVEAYMPQPAVDRDLWLLVYTDTSGTGDVASSTLVHTQPARPQSLGFNEFVLDVPIALVSGDFYLGFQDRVSDPGSPEIAAFDNSDYFADSFQGENTTNPADLVVPWFGRTWMIRTNGGGVADGFVTLNWDAPCGGGQALQDYAIYRGQIGSYEAYASSSCTSELVRSHFSDLPGDSFFLVVPRTSSFEGSYGRNSQGTERPQAELPCKPQLIGSCPE